MPLSIESWDVIFHNSSIASAAFWCKHVKVVTSAVGFTITLMEALLAKLLTTLSTEEMFCMPSFLQSRHTFLQKKKRKTKKNLIKPSLKASFYLHILSWSIPHIENSSIAVSTAWTEEIVIVGFTIGMSIPLKEIPRTQFLIAVIARKMFRMPCLAQCRNHLPHNGFIATRAASLLCRCNTLTIHIGLQIP